MKKTLLFVLALVLSVTLMAQSRLSILSQNFSGASMPSGWTIAGMGTSNWSIAPSGNAGGVANELKLYYDPSFNGTSRFVSPAVDLTGISSVVFMFKHCLDNYTGSHTLGVATSSDNGATWHEAWSQSYGNDGQYSVSCDVATEDMGKANVKFCISYTGNSYNIDNWYFDDIAIFTLENLDASLNSIDVPDFVSAGNVTASFTVSNMGNTTITSIEANYQYEGSDAVTETFATNIQSLGSASFTFAVPTNLVPSSYNLLVNLVTINGVEDDDLNNNSLSKTVGTSLGTAQKIPMIEHFSSSTCGPCVSVNNTMQTFTANNPDKFTYTKYQMNWPGTGDPYYTAEGGVRRTYYGVSGVPDIAFDGALTSNAPVSQNLFDQHYNSPAFAEIRGSFVVEGNNITVIADAMSYVDMSDVRLYISVNEKRTTGNVGSNGETEFHHVMMKMLEDAAGNTIDITGGEYTRVEYTCDMSSTHVEEMSDLEVSAWLQNYTTKEVFNSHFLYENVAHPYPATNLQLADNSDNTMTASWESPTEATPVGYNVWVNGELVLQISTDLSYTFTTVDGNYYIVEVQAVYADYMTSVKAVKGALVVNSVAVEESANIACSIYPNPANGSVKVLANDDIQMVSIYNAIGVLVDRINVGANNAEINTTKYNSGVYFINVMQTNGMSSTKRLVITH